MVEALEFNIDDYQQHNLIESKDIFKVKTVESNKK